MIDLHCHLLPNIDDGSPDDEHSLEMARLAVADGVTMLACTPHIFPGVYNNVGPDIRERVVALQARLDEVGVPLTLLTGSDLHIAPDLVSKLQSGEALSLHDTRYVLIETPHHVLPPRVEDVFFSLMAAGYVPILTHPERMTWIERNYDVVQRLFRSGVWMQLTGSALLGNFGSQAKYWSERMLDDGMFHIVASDAHDATHRPPLLRPAFEELCRRVGEEEALNLVLHRPQAILEDRPVSEIVRPLAGNTETDEATAPLWERFSALWRRA